MRTFAWPGAVLSLAVLIGLTGCTPVENAAAQVGIDIDGEGPTATGGATPPTGASRTGGAAGTQFRPDVDAGIRVEVAADPTRLANLVASRRFGTRPDPFALLPAELAFERSQRAERFVQESGGWSIRYTPPEEETTQDMLEPQPYRRLAGVLVGDTVSAILIMEDGRAEIVRPGMRIPNSEWTVASIDETRAVLTRTGNRLPRQIVVNLESPPAGLGVGVPGGPGVPGGFPGAPARPGGGGFPGRGGQFED
ncbi:MAG: hypothetical protein SNJ74_08710 [Fimbriimonadaceae bacterium]